jgi:hypothetical protein
LFDNNASSPRRDSVHTLASPKNNITVNT